MTASRSVRGSAPLHSIKQTVLILFAVLIALESGYLMLLVYFVGATKSELAVARKLRNEVTAIAAFTSDMQLGTSAVADRLHFHKLLANYRKVFLRLPEGLQQLKMTFKDHPEEQRRISELESNVDETLAIINKMFDSAVDGDSKEGMLIQRSLGVQLFRVAQEMTDQVDSLNAKYSAIEKSNVNSLVAQSEQLLYLVLIAGFAINAIVGLLVYRFFVRNLGARLKVIDNNIRNYGKGKALLPAVDGDDEIAQLDRTFRNLVARLERSKTKESAILENSSSFICSLNRSGIILSVPSRGAANWGYVPDDLIGKRFISFVKDSSPGTTYEALQKVSEQPSHFDNQLELKNGSVLELTWSALKAAEDNIVCVAQDVTESKRLQNIIRISEERLRVIINSMPLAVVSCDSQGKIETANRAALDLSQKEPVLKGLDVMSLFSDDIALAPLLKRALKQPVILTLKRPEGSLPVELSVSKFSVAGGETYLFCFHDISARNEIEKAKADFVSMIAHDLRSPLFALHGTLSMMAADQSDADDFSMDANVARNTEIFVRSEITVSHLIALINDFLTLGKLEANQQVLSKHDIPLIDFWDVLRTELSSSKEVIFEALPEKWNPTLNLDREQLVATADYLVNLQLYFNPSGPVRVLFSGLGGQVQMVIYSTGKLLPPAIKANCREGYAMVSLNSDSEYSGLRLALCRAIIEQHSGVLAVETRAGTDAIVITLPIKQ